MASDVSKGSASFLARRLLLQFLGYCRTNIRTIVSAVALIIVMSELAGIWHEVHQLRNEQVKNALYALPEARREAIRATVGSKRLESTAIVNGTVEVDGEVQLAEPVEVEVDQ